jgi:hypothetical protein
LYALTTDGQVQCQVFAEKRILGQMIFGHGEQARHLFNIPDRTSSKTNNRTGGTKDLDPTGQTTHTTGMTNQSIAQINEDPSLRLAALRTFATRPHDFTSIGNLLSISKRATNKILSFLIHRVNGCCGYKKRQSESLCLF